MSILILGTHWIINVTYFDSFVVEHVLKEIKKIFGNKNMQTNTFRIQAYYSVKYGYFCIVFITFMLAGEILTDFTTNCFVADFKERELMGKMLSKYIASFDYFDKSLIVLSAINGSTSIASFTAVIGAPVGISNSSFSFAFSRSTGIVKKLLKATRNKKKNAIKFLCYIEVN